MDAYVDREPAKDSRVQVLSRSLAELDPHTRLPAAVGNMPGTRISDAVYEQLSEAIRSLRLPPGTPLSEPAVADWLSVSRSPVREAFKRLVDLGLVNVVPQVGSQVAPVSLRDVEEAVFVRSALETSAFQRAIRQERLDMTEIERILDENRKAFASRDAEAFFETDDLLHQNIFVLAGMPRLWDLVRGTKLQLDRLRRLHLGGAMENPEIVHEHEQIVNAIRDRDETAGVQMIHHHANRILNDTEGLRARHPLFFEA